MVRSNLLKEFLTFKFDLKTKNFNRNQSFTSQTKTKSTNNVEFVIICMQKWNCLSEGKKEFMCLSKMTERWKEKQMRVYTLLNPFYTVLSDVFKLSLVLAHRVHSK